MCGLPHCSLSVTLSVIAIVTVHGKIMQLMHCGLHEIVCMMIIAA